MLGWVIFLLGCILGFAYSAKTWLAIRMREGRRCIPKVFLWRGTRNSVVFLALLFILRLGGQNSGSSSASSQSSSAEALGVIIAATFIFLIGMGIGSGLSNVVGGLLSFATEGPYEPSEEPSDATPSKHEKIKTDDYGQLK